MPDLVNTAYDRGKCELLYDDLGLANPIVRGKEDLTVTGVVDLEWSYVGPAQLFGSAPWWLLQDRPVNSTWDYKHEREPPKITARSFKYLETFVRILEEEEADMPGHEARELSGLVKWSPASGAMWLQASTTVAALKVRELGTYDEALERMEEGKALVDSGKMTKEEFVIDASKDR